MGKSLRAVKFLVRYANKTRAAKELMEDWNCKIQFDLSGEEPFYVKAENGRLSVHKGRIGDPDATIKATAKTFLDIATGKLDQDEAFQLKKYEVVGSISDGVRLRRVSELTREGHRFLFAILTKLSFLL